MSRMALLAIILAGLAPALLSLGLQLSRTPPVAAAAMSATHSVAEMTAPASLCHRPDGGPATGPCLDAAAP